MANFKAQRIRIHNELYLASNANKNANSLKQASRIENEKNEDKKRRKFKSSRHLYLKGASRSYLSKAINLLTLGELNAKLRRLQSRCFLMRRQEVLSNSLENKLFMNRKSVTPVADRSRIFETNFPDFLRPFFFTASPKRYSNSNAFILIII